MHPMVIGKYANPRCFKNQDVRTFNFAANKNAWMTSVLFTSQIMKWDTELRSQNRKILLLVDKCSCHIDINEKLTHIRLAFFPPNVTSLLQPLDQGIIKNFKQQYRRMTVSKMLQAFEMKNQFSMTVLDALHMVKNAWDDVTVSTIQNSFIHSGLVSREQIDSSTKSVDLDESMAKLMFLIC